MTPSTRSRPTRRGAAGQQYAIIVGLVGVIAILAVTQMGSGVKSLMANTGNTLTNVVNGTVGSGGGSGGGGGGGGSCTMQTRANCAAHYTAGCTTSGVFTVQPAATPVDVWCEMSLDGGGWTHIMTVNGSDGSSIPFYSGYWGGLQFNPVGDRWNDHKNRLATDLAGNSMLIVVRKAAAAPGATGSDLKGWRSWNLSPARSMQAMFDLPIGAYNANSSGGGCNAGHSGAGTQVTSGIKTSGQCASYNEPSDGLAEDTFTCYANNVYANSYYGGCETTGDGFRLSSWYRWANNSNVGLGIQMDGGNNYTGDAGTHMAIDTHNAPQRRCNSASPSCVNTGVGTSVNTSPGTDKGTDAGFIGESWRYEIYQK